MRWFCGRRRSVDVGVMSRRRDDPREVTSNSDSSVPSRLCDTTDGSARLSDT